MKSATGEDTPNGREPNEDGPGREPLLATGFGEEVSREEKQADYATSSERRQHGTSNAACWQRPELFPILEGLLANEEERQTDRCHGDAVPESHKGGRTINTQEASRDGAHYAYAAHGHHDGSERAPVEGSPFHEGSNYLEMFTGLAGIHTRTLPNKAAVGKPAFSGLAGGVRRSTFGGMVVEIINTGSELMLGRTLNTHQQWLCRRLADLGRVVTRQVAVPDTGPDIVAAVQESLSRADLVITTGGLGPTSDDITRDLIAGMLGRKLYEDPAILQRIESFFESRKRPMPASTRIQAMVPEGARVLLNRFGTAPGLALRLENTAYRSGPHVSWLIMLPGPPRELRPMFDDQVVPLLAEELPAANAFRCRTLRSIGVGESMVEQRIAPLLASLVERGLEIGYCARPGRVDVRLVAAGASADEVVTAAEKAVRSELGAAIYGVEDEELEDRVIHTLTERVETLALAESCTGGYISNLLTNVPGASAVLLAGIVTYSNKAKQELLGVNHQTLAANGAVSEPTAREMAEGARRVTGARYAIAVTGIAGPGGATPDKPVGTVFIGLATPEGTHVFRNLNTWDRETFKQVTAQQALNLLLQRIQ